MKIIFFQSKLTTWVLFNPHVLFCPFLQWYSSFLRISLGFKGTKVIKSKLFFSSYLYYQRSRMKWMSTWLQNPIVIFIFMGDSLNKSVINHIMKVTHVKSLFCFRSLMLLRVSKESQNCWCISLFTPNPQYV